MTIGITYLMKQILTKVQDMSSSANMMQWAQLKQYVTKLKDHAPDFLLTVRVMFASIVVLLCMVALSQ